jgi:hypothetical protein
LIEKSDDSTNSPRISSLVNTKIWERVCVWCVPTEAEGGTHPCLQECQAGRGSRKKDLASAEQFIFFFASYGWRFLLRLCSPLEYIDDNTDSDVIRLLLVLVPVYGACEVSLAK